MEGVDPATVATLHHDACYRSFDHLPERERAEINFDHPVDPARILIVDGILIFSEPDLRERMDIRIFVDTDADVRLVRRLRRDLVERGRSVASVLAAVLGQG